MIVDPPRAGLHPKVIKVLRKTNVSRIVYVSCNTAALARDLALFGEEFHLKARYDDIAPLQADGKVQAEIDKIYLGSGVSTTNEVRERNGEEEVEWGDVPILPINVAPLGTIPTVVTPGQVVKEAIGEGEPEEVDEEASALLAEAAAARAAKVPSTEVAMQKGWGLAEQSFDVRASFVVGEYALRRGTLTVRYMNSETRLPVPFVTIHRVVDGRVAERVDFGEYVESFGMGDGFDDNTASTKQVADRYLRAYLDADLETQAELAAPEIQFQDPTSQVFGPPAGELYKGSEELIRRRKQIYEGIVEFDLEVAESFVANHHAVYMGTTTYTTANGMSFRQPAVFVIEVKDGKVTRQWDFVDYSVGPIGS